MLTFILHICIINTVRKTHIKPKNNIIKEQKKNEKKVSKKTSKF